MSEHPRRQVPSPLVLSPDANQPSSNPSLGSGSNTVSMPFVRRHVTRRLKTAKADCDKELRRVINNITTFFEEKLREADQDRDVDRDSCRDRDPDRDSQYGDSDFLHDSFLYHPRPVSQADDYSDSGYEAEPEGRHSRQLSTTSSFSPALRRQNTNPWEKSIPTPPSSSAGPSPVVPATSLSDTASPRRQSNAIPPTAWPSQSLPSRRLSRTVHIPIRPVRSGQSSRSTSRSRSPLPPATTHGSFSDVLPISTVNRRSSRILVDDPVDPIMTALYDLIAVATDVTEMSCTQLTSQPKVCESLVQRVQHIGKAWDDHPDWHGRNWYVQVLLAVASLSRVVEWWEAEKQFWNFDDNNEDEQDEPLMFVLKPSDEPLPAPTPTTRGQREEGPLRLSLEDEHRLRMGRVVSQGRRPRDDPSKELLRKSTSPDPSSRTPNKLPEHNESARVLATERLRLQAETAQNQNIIMELSLDGDHFIWVNYAWRVVVGTEPFELSGTRISHLLAPSDWTVFRDATQRLQQDDSRTVEVGFRLQVQPDSYQEPVANGVLYQQMEGKGMLMIDREDAQPSHTMWVVKPIASPRYEYPSPSIILESGEVSQESLPQEAHATEFMADVPVTPFPFTQPISTELILCRICECHIPQWYFEKHSETCVEVHHLEAEIGECNESISELKNTIKDLLLALETSSPAMTPEYRGVPIFTPSTSPSMSSPLQLFRTNKMQRVGVKKMQRRLLEQLDDVLQVALEITIPSLKEEESKEPIERQRLLSPTSERKMSQVRNWCKPTIEDAALTQLVEDTERIMRQKVDNAVRMQNTIRYSEKIWHEWEEKVEESLATVDYEEDSDDENELALIGGTTPEIMAEIALPQVASESASTSSVEDILSSGPTPIAPSSPAPAVPVESRQPVSMPVPTSIPPSWQMMNKMPTRSSTPSSISSPLALAEPITASACPDDHPPFMDLNELPPENGTLRARRSATNLLEPRLLVTPPLSPNILPRDAPITTRRGHRRHSTVNPMFSPTSSNVPLSPRQPSAAPLSRSTPTSIKDFDIIKPISKGAFGSVFLTKKKATGDYYAIKVLKKADMIAKNQITNVKAERNDSHETGGVAIRSEAILHFPKQG
ncbi:hypothetical protein JVU11DRAFT_1656 [Chiua virens]|nr:hypothetical protein JVU11DRAFT_1656 [Chiua virens]